MDKDEKGRFVKGHKINEGRPAINAGRKPMPEQVLEVKERMQALDPGAMDVIENALKDIDPKVRRETAWEVYRYNHGKPKESMDFTGIVGAAPLTGDRFTELYREMKNEQLDSKTTPEIDSQGAVRAIALRGDE